MPAEVACYGVIRDGSCVVQPANVKFSNRSLSFCPHNSRFRADQLGVEGYFFAGNGDVGMGYMAIVLAIVGLVTGLMFRTRILLAIVALLLLVSVGFAVSSGYSFLNTALTVLIAQTILQASYFLGLVVAASFHRLVPRHGSVDAAQPIGLERALAGEEPAMVFDTPSKTSHLPHLFARGIAQDQ